jgi:hypothetical protein
MKKRTKLYNKNKITDLWQKRASEYSEETKKIIENGYVTEPTALYHYTSIDVLKNIMQTKELWYTYYQDLDDGDELILSYKECKMAIEEIANQSKKENFWKPIRDIFCQDNFLKRFSVYTISLSTENDSSELWESFGDNHKGCIIKFKEDFSQPKEVAQVSKNDPLVISAPINYQKEDFISQIKQFAFLAEARLDGIVNEKIRLTKDIIREFHIRLICDIISIIPLNIKEKYSTEKELRRFIIELHHNNNYYPSKIPEYLKSTENSKRIVKSIFKYEDIDEIIIGKNADIGEIQRYISEICCNPSIKVKKASYA